jgi:hypothetical protein
MPGQRGVTAAVVLIASTSMVASPTAAAPTAESSQMSFVEALTGPADVDPLMACPQGNGWCCDYHSLVATEAQ